MVKWFHRTKDRHSENVPEKDPTGKVLTQEESRIIVTEIENQINIQALTYLDDSFVNIKALTPSHLIYGRKIKAIPSIDVSEVISYPTVNGAVQYSRQSYHNVGKLLKITENIGI